MLDLDWWTGPTIGCALFCVGLCMLRINLNALAALLFVASAGVCGGEAIRMQLGPFAGAWHPTCQRVARVAVRCDGIVEHVISAGPRSQRYILRGEIDARCAPCVLTRVLISETASGRPLLAGQRRIVTGQLRRPLWPTLENEFSEGSYVRSMGCALVIERARGVDAGPAPAHMAWVVGLRQMAATRITQALAADVASVVIALVIGDRSMLDPESRLAYRLSGTAHMFSVSGSHVAIITWLVMLVIGPRSHVMMLAVGIAIIIVYTVITGAEAPAVRSAIMGIGTIIGRRRQRDVSPVNMLLLSVYAIVLIDPLASLSGGFALSVTATMTLIVLQPKCRQLLQSLLPGKHRLLHVVLEAISVSWAATLGVTVPAAVAFGALSLTSPLANIVVVPLLSVALVLGLALTVLPVIIFSDALAWWLTVMVRSADMVARALALDTTGGLSGFDVMWFSMVVTVCLAWPLHARTWKGLCGWFALSIGLAGTVLLILKSEPRRSEAPVIIERRSGLVIEYASKKGRALTLMGTEPGPVDRSLVRWAQQRRHQVVVGLGFWGRRMKGAIPVTTDSTRR